MLKELTVYCTFIGAWMRDFYYLLGYMVLLNGLAACVCLLLVGVLDVCVNSFLVMLGCGVGARLLSWAWYYPKSLRLQWRKPKARLGAFFNR